MGTIKIFIKDNCPRCPVAKKLYEDLTSRLGDSVNVEKYNVGNADGLAEATMNMVQATPTVLVFDTDENTVREWRGDVPSFDEVEPLLKEMSPGGFGRVQYASMTARKI